MSLRVLALEPYYGGSHRAFLDGYRRHSRHRVWLLTMPARKWKWRMRGAAVSMAPQVRRLAGEFDVLLASDFLDLACLAGLTADVLDGIARVVYFHENQITYPLPPEADRDYQFGFTNITTCLAADRVLFNSDHHRREFLDGAAGLLAKMPDHVPAYAPDALRRRSEVVPVGEGKVNITEVELDQVAPVVGKQLMDIALPEGSLVGYLLRDEEPVVCRGSTELRAGDRLILITVPEDHGPALRTLTGETL